MYFSILMDKNTEGPATESEQKDEDEEKEDEKDAIIKDLQTKLKEAELNIELLQDELLREKLINNKIIGLQSKIPVSSTQYPASSSLTPISSSMSRILDSPVITPGQGKCATTQKVTQASGAADLSLDFNQLDLPSQLNLPSEPSDSDVCDSTIVESGSSKNCERLKTKQSEASTQSTTKSNGETDGQTQNDLAPLHPRDMGPANKLGYILNSLQNVPSYRSTAMIGASNFHYINQGEIDPTNKSVAIRSVSGLCVVSAAHALKKFRYQYHKFRKIIWCLGINDYMHQDIHCPDDWATHLSDLISETGRIFPQATIHFILPFSGLPGVPQSFIQEMEKTLKAVGPNVKRHHTPSMSGMVRSDGIHLTSSGAQKLRAFLVSTFTRHESNIPQQRANRGLYYDDNIPRRPPNTYNSYSDAVSVNPLSNRVPNAHLSYQPPPPPFMPEYPPPPIEQHGSKQDVIKEMTEALVSLLCSHMKDRSGI